MNFVGVLFLGQVRVFFLESVPEAADWTKAPASGNSSADVEDVSKKRYADSIESLIRNTIQQMKIDMANEVIDAGRFDGQTTNEERKQTLESLLADVVRRLVVIDTHSAVSDNLALA